MSNTDIIPAEIFPPGEFIRDELAARGWEQRDLAEIMGRPERTISELVSGKRSITPETAQQLGEAFGSTPQFWLNLETAYRLWRLPRQDGSVARRARLYALAPIKELARRGWIRHSERVEVLEAEVKRFLGIPTLDETPADAVAVARKSSGDAVFSPVERAWVCRARQLAKKADAARFDASRLELLWPRLKALRARAEDVREVPRVLGSSGIRLVIVEQIAGAKIDGACFWLPAKQPVVALSLRFDRIDCFWFTLMHELGHVAAGDGRDSEIPPDVELVGNAEGTPAKRPAFEAAADRFASRFLLAERALAEFIAKTRPYYSKERVETFAREHAVHPGLVVGQLQHRGEIPYANFRSHLVKVRSQLLETTVADGWGISPIAED